MANMYGTSAVHCGNEPMVMFGAGKDGATRNRRKTDYIKSLSDEELRALSLEKAENRCYTELAIEAQKEIYKRGSQI